MCYRYNSSAIPRIHYPAGQPHGAPRSGKARPTKEQRQDKWREGQSCRMETALDEDDVSLNNLRLFGRK